MDRLLSGCYFAGRHDQFIEFWKANTNVNFLLVATREGEVIDCRGLIHGGRTTGKKSSSVLERESEIRRLRREIEAERAALNELREQANALDERRNVAEATVEEQRKRQSELGSEVSGLVAEEKIKIRKSSTTPATARKRKTRSHASTPNTVIP